MINASQLLADLQSKSTSRTTLVKKLEDDLRKRCDREPEVDAPLKERYNAAKTKKRASLTYGVARGGSDLDRRGRRPPLTRPD